MSVEKVFIGATEKQLVKIKKQEEIEMEYILFVRNNPNLEISEYEKKYKSLKIKNK